MIAIDEHRVIEVRMPVCSNCVNGLCTKLCDNSLEVGYCRHRYFRTMLATFKRTHSDEWTPVLENQLQRMESDISKIEQRLEDRGLLLRVA